MNYRELQDFFKDFQWIDNIPEDQSARDKICLEAKAALLIKSQFDFLNSHIIFHNLFPDIAEITCFKDHIK